MRATVVRGDPPPSAVRCLGGMAFDRRRTLKEEREAFKNARRAESTYARELRKVARQIGALINGADVVSPDGEIDPSALPALQRSLDLYAQAILPWSRSVAKRMLAEVARRDIRAWHGLADRMGRALRAEIETAPTGVALRALLDEQVGLITSLPIEAGQRVHHLVTGALSNSTRAGDIAKEIMRSGHVTASRAALIARTETGRAATGLTMARALYVGSTHFQWMTSGDADVRPRHKKLDGKVFAWTDPPVAGENGERYLPGSGPNCRCFAAPIVPPVR